MVHQLLQDTCKDLLRIRMITKYVGDQTWIKAHIVRRCGYRWHERIKIERERERGGGGKT